MRGAVAGQDALIITVSPASLSAIKEKPDYFSRGTKYCIDAMKEYGVKRLVILTAHGVGDSQPVASWFQRTFFIGALLKGFFHDHDVQERLTRESGLDFVIARPTRLTNGKAKGKYVRTADVVSVPATISRADLADFMVEACESPTWVGKPCISAGEAGPLGHTPPSKETWRIRIVWPSLRSADLLEVACGRRWDRIRRAQAPNRAHSALYRRWF